MVKINKRAKSLLIIALSVLLFVVTVFMGIRLYFRLPVMSYYQASEKAFLIPDISNDFVPQGLHYDKENKYFITSGYSSKDEPSTVHVTEKDTGKTIYSVELLNEDGTPHEGHAGGVAQYNDWVYVAGSSSHCLYVYSYSQILSGVKQVKAIGKYSLEISDTDYLKASFVSVMGNRLVVGEFFNEPSYKTLDSHKTTSSSGEKFGGIALEFALNGNLKFGIATRPIRAFALPDKVQGVYFTDNDIYLSTSLGLKSSYVYKHDVAKLETGSNIDVLGVSLELKMLTSKSLVSTYKTPPMSEEIAIVDGKLYVMSEFACNKYVLGKFTSAKWCYATDLSNL